ncbi:MAG: PH domain-containing protein [Tetrasphaera sp.]|nr:PH domain-containing protein [Tetrasphaera sp.]
MSVALYAAAGLPWRPVSPLLATTRRLVAVICVGIATTGATAAALFLTRWAWSAVAVLVLILAWVWWLIGRQVSAFTYAELSEELVIRRGRIFRSLVSIPYGRLQYADMSSGPIARHFGLASVTVYTASPGGGEAIHGLPLAEAEGLRDRLTALGEAQRAGL